jgi:transcription antitermination factor NusG
MPQTPAVPPSGLEEQADRLFCPGEENSLWYVLHTRPRCEKKAAQVCLDFQIRHYLPLRKSAHPRRKGQRQYSFEVPLFTSYLFACCDSMGRYQLMCSDYLVRTIEVVDQELLLDELRQIHRALASPAELVLYPRLRRGRRVRVLRGPLTGVVGRIAHRKGTFRLVLNVTILGTAVAAELDVEDVAPC